MARNEPDYNLRCFFVDGTPITQDNQHLTRVNQLSKFQAKGMVKQFNEMPKEIGEVVFNRLLLSHT